MTVIFFLIKAIIVIFLLMVIGTFTIGAYSFMSNLDIESGLSHLDKDTIEKYSKKGGKKE